MHVESGAVLASRVRLDRTVTRQHLAWLRGNSVRGEEATLVVAPTRWMHTFFASSPTDVAFVGGDGKVLQVRRGLKPWRVAFSFKASAAIQGTPGFVARTNTRVGDRLALREEQAARPARDFVAWRPDLEEEPEAARARFEESVAAALQDDDSGAEPWGVEPGDEAAPSPDAPVAQPPPPPPAAARPPVSEGARASSAAPVPLAPSHRHAFSRGVDLAALTGRQMPLAWFEAVAIAQEMCAVLLAGRRSGPPAEFEPEDVAITAEGSVEVRGGASHAMPTVPQAGHILLTLLGAAQTVPVQLRLLALQEVSPTPRCTTLGEFSAQLAVYERPNRQTAIREVYQRFMALPPEPVEERAAAPGPPPRAVRARKARAPLWRHRKVRVAATAVALVVMVIFAGSLAWQVAVPLISGGKPAGSASGSGSAGGTSLSEEAVARIREAARRIWLGAGTPRPEPVPARVPAAQPAVLELPPAVPPGSLANPAGGVRPPDVATDSRPALPDTMMFSAANADVAPPVLRRPHLPATPRPGVRVEDLPQVEIVVSPAGEVESVKLLTSSAGVHSAMMLSAIKTWHFQPATRDGLPVRYRLLMRLTNQ